MVTTYVKKIVHNMISMTGVYLRDIINMVLVGQVSELVENINIEIYSGTINVINLKLCMMVLFIELYLFIPLSVTLTIFQGHSNVRQF